jgi:hypothetical protein
MTAIVKLDGVCSVGEINYGAGLIRVVPPGAIPADLWPPIPPAPSTHSWLQCWAVESDANGARRISCAAGSAQGTTKGTDSGDSGPPPPPIPPTRTNPPTLAFDDSQLATWNPELRTNDARGPVFVQPWPAGTTTDGLRTFDTLLAPLVAWVDDPRATVSFHVYNVFDPRPVPLHPLHRTTIAIPIGTMTIV